MGAMEDGTSRTLKHTIWSFTCTCSLLDVGPNCVGTCGRLAVHDVQARQGYSRHGQWDRAWLGNAVEGGNAHALDTKCEWDDVSNMHLRAIDLDGDAV